MEGASKVKQDLATALAKGKRKQALECYEQLEILEPREGQWPHRAGELYQQLDKTKLAIPAWTRAAEKYAKAGFLLKAVAMCRTILRVQPQHTDTQDRLAKLQAASLAEGGSKLRRPGRQTQNIAAVAGKAAQAGEPLTNTRLFAPPNQQRPITLVPLDAGEQFVVETDGVYFGNEVDASASAELATGSEPAADAPDKILVDRAEQMKNTPFFSELPPDALKATIERMSLIDLPSGQVLFEEGDAGDNMYVIVEGEVAVLVTAPGQTEAGQLVRLGEGNFFGEIALLTEENRTATIRATQNTQLLSVDRKAVGELVSQYPGVLRVLLRFLRQRLVETLIRTSPLFEPFSEGDRADLAKRFRFLEVEPGAVMLKQGDMADALYVLLCGSADCLRTENGVEKPINTIGRGDLFGMSSLLSQEPAIATIRTNRRCWALAMPASDFREVIMTHPQLLAYVGEIAEEHRQRLSDIASGQVEYDEEHIDIF
jgi:cAMP-dependent protein kinase regulator